MLRRQRQMCIRDRVQSALSELKGTPTRIERCHTSSLSALRSILDKHAV